MTDNLIEALSQKLQVIFSSLVQLIEPLNKDFKHTIGNSSNDTFPIRAYVSFMKSSDGDEIAITVDAKYVNRQLLIVSDISSDDGTIIAEGPTALISHDINNQTPTENSAIEANKWFDEFEIFLELNTKTIRTALLKMTS